MTAHRDLCIKIWRPAAHGLTQLCSNSFGPTLHALNIKKHKTHFIFNHAIPRLNQTKKVPMDMNLQDTKRGGYGWVAR